MSALRTRRRPARRMARVLAAMVVLVGGAGGRLAFAQAGGIPAQLQAPKSPTPGTIEKGQWATVLLTIIGDTKQQPSPVPSAVVMAIDYSGSMGNNNAYQQASEAAKKALDLLAPGVDSVGILRISTTADWLVPLAPLTASSLAAHKQVIDAQQPDGSTNYKDAFDKANAALAGYTAPNKLVVFFSDGEPFPDTLLQQTYVYQHRYDPAASGIRYYTIGYGPGFSTLLLQEMAEATGGAFCQSGQSPTDLEKAFKDALVAGRTTATAQGVEIVEVVNSKLRIRPGSLTWSSIPPTVNLAQFQTTMLGLAATFDSSHSLTVPTLNELALNQNFSLAFDVTSDDCLDGETLDVPIDAPTSVVHWHSAGVSQTLSIPAKQMSVSPCDVHLSKDYDPATSTVTLKVRNDLPRPIDTVQVIEVTLADFRPAAPFVPPPETLNLPFRQVRWGTFGTNTLSLQAGKEAVFSFRLSGETTKAGPLPINFSRAGVSYEADKRIFAIPASDPAYTTLVQDAQNGVLSPAGAAAVNARMAAAGFVVAVPAGTVVKKELPPSEFGYLIDGTPQWRTLKLKVTPVDLQVYSRLLGRKSFPQAYTPVGHVVPK